jgi:hypothetical protein
MRAIVFVLCVVVAALAVWWIHALIVVGSSWVWSSP